ncbi:Capsid VP1 [Gossypium arboreum]|uniref:Capsid VP1 n=1 Tax=Gossypium arboreum TaxID=29729 RepID=A0A0B0PWT7_GOSAR|nr:Capsid VP1 [Gossypium arboreum]
MGLLTQAISQDVATRCWSQKLSSNRNICQYTQPPVGRTGPAPRSHNIIP